MKIYLALLTLLWGYASGELFVSLLGGFLILLSRFISKKWDFKPKDFIRISDLCSIILIALSVKIGLESKARFFILNITTVTPIVLLPLLLSQIFSTSETVVIGTNIGKKGPHKHKPLNIIHPYAISLYFAIAASNPREKMYFFMLFIFICWHLILISKRKDYIRIATVFAITLITAFFIQHTFRTTHLAVREKMRAFFINYFRDKNRDPFKTVTTIGEIGRIKTSSAIVLRAELKQITVPILLRESIYDLYAGGTWFNRKDNFTSIQYSNDRELFLAKKEKPPYLQIKIYKQMETQKGSIPVPLGTFLIENLNASGLRTEPSGTIFAEETAEDIEYTASFTSKSEILSAIPDKRDIQIPKDEENFIKEFLKLIELNELSDAEKADKITHYLKDTFFYSLNQPEIQNGYTPLGYFMLKRKAGHCEYFATALTLLLREIEIPARYVTGYALYEKSGIGNYYIAREKDAHAWTEAYINGKWIQFDATPNVWIKEAENESSIFQPISDLISFLKFKYTMLRMHRNRDNDKYLIFAVIGLTLILIVRIYMRTQRKGKMTEQIEKTFTSGKDSPLFQLIRQIEETTSMPRESEETFKEYILRVLPDKFDKKKLQEATYLHEKYRFDTNGITEEEFEKLAKLVENMTKELLQNEI